MPELSGFGDLLVQFGLFGGSVGLFLFLAFTGKIWFPPQIEYLMKENDTLRAANDKLVEANSKLLEADDTRTKRLTGLTRAFNKFAMVIIKAIPTVPSQEIIELIQTDENENDDDSHQLEGA